MMVVYESVEGEASAVIELLRRAGDEVAEVVGFEAKPEVLNGIKVRAVGREEPALEVVPIEAGGLVPARVVEDEDAAFARVGKDGLGEVIEVALEGVGIHQVEEHRKAAPGLGADSSDDVGADVVARVGDLRAASLCAPAPPRARVTFDAGLVAIPDFDRRVLLQYFELLLIPEPLGVVLTLRPALRHTQIVIEFVQVANRGAVALFNGKLFSEPAVDFDARPVNLPGLCGLFEHWD